MTVQTNNKLASFAIKLALGGVLIVLVGLAYLFLTPKTYRAYTRLKVIDWIPSRDLDHPSDLRIIPAECELLRSNAVSDAVIKNLDLPAAWGKRYHQGTVLSADDTRALLLSKAIILPVPNSSLIDIVVTSEDRNETAKIANEWARVYLAFRNARHDELVQEKLAALKQQWDQENQKVQTAQAAVDKLYFEISKSRSTNQTQLYDVATYDLLVSKRAELEGAYAAQKKQLANLKKMEPEKLKQVLSSMDTNSLLTPALRLLSKASSESADAALTHGSDSPETKSAALAVTELNQKIDQLLATTMDAKEADLVGLKATLDGLNQKIKNATTNPAQVGPQDADYKKASAELARLKQERDELREKMDRQESVEAIRPQSVTTDVIDTAEIPARPFTPDGKAGLQLLAAGGLLSVGGLILLPLSRRTRAQPRR